jgi:pimeloyl-ACP methyl ester carboxylesterase
MILFVQVFVVGPGVRMAAAQGNDLGGIFKKAAREVLEKAIDGPPPQGTPPKNSGGRRTSASASPVAETTDSLTGFARSFFERDRGEMVAVQTRDGWTLVAHHYAPAAPPPAGSMPVILCHGLSYNASFWDLDPGASLPKYLASKGWDVWVVDLRGSGYSQKWVWKIDQAPEQLIGGAIRRLTRNKITPTGYATIDPKYANWNLDQHIAFDVPAFVQLVRKRTGAPQVAWIGHSMGGIVALCHLARYGNPGIGKLVTVGSQVTMPDAQIPLQFLSEMIQTRTEQMAGQLSGEQLLAESKTSMHNLFFNQANVNPSIYEALGTWATDVPAIGVMQQYQELGMKGELWDAKKQFNYARAIGKIQVPILIATGAGDQFAPPVVQKYLYDHIGSTDKQALVIGRRQGFAVDAGHDDALVGLNSRRQVYPVIETWLLRPNAGTTPAQAASETAGGAPRSAAARSATTPAVVNPRRE